jgi:hypothetical protein
MGDGSMEVALRRSFVGRKLLGCMIRKQRCCDERARRWADAGDDPIVSVCRAAKHRAGDKQRDGKERIATAVEDIIV